MYYVYYKSEKKMWKEKIRANIIEVLVFLLAPNGPSRSPYLCSRLCGGHCLVPCPVVRLELRRTSTSCSVTFHLLLGPQFLSAAMIRRASSEILDETLLSVDLLPHTRLKPCWRQD